MKRVQDPIVLEIVKNLLNTTAEEMGLAVVRSAYSVRLKEKGDASSAIFDAEGRVIAQSQGTPLQHLSSMRPSLQSVLQDYPPGQIRDGDVYLMNDPYRGAIHSNDCIVYRPVFYNGVLSFFTAALVHVADIGGMAAGGLPANATEIYHEGLIIPPLKLQDAGEPNDTLVKILMANSRTPDKLMGDLRALQAATTLGARRIISLVEKYGYEDILRIAHETMDYSEQRMRKDIAKIPAGTYEGSYLIDDDGSDSSRRYRVHVTVEGRGSHVYVDLAGTDPPARGPINAAFSQSMSGVMMGVRCFLDPSIPMNEGCWRPLKINLPLGSLVNPKMPAPCNARVITVCAIIESIIQALSKAMPERGVAASCVNHVYTLNGTDPATGRRWIYMENDFGGVGARSIKDGPDATGPHIFGGGWANPVEAGEVEFPVRIDEYGMWRDSGGPGRFHGGPPPKFQWQREGVPPIVSSPEPALIA